MTRADAGTGGELPPAWRLPAGMDAALWTYAHCDRLADEDDAYFAGHPLHEADLAYAIARLRPPAVVADLGCGSGRITLALARRGFEVVAVDLAPAMLRRLRRVVRAENLPVLALRANLCDLRSLRPASCDAALLLFSTLGMIRGRAARRRALLEAAQLVRPGGLLILHAHNLWQNLRDPAGRGWLMTRAAAILGRHESAGDRPMTYRGVPGLVVHQYRLGELRADLRSAGWRIEELEPIDAATAQPIPFARLLPGLRAGGWLLTARRAG